MRPRGRALAGIGTALYRAYLGRLAPLVPGLVAEASRSTRSTRPT